MTKDTTVNILIAGVGGQGTVLASKILGHVAMAAGFDVKQSEIHGMSQRGGSVVTHVRYGKKIYSPLVAAGNADVIMAFEELEALRYLPYLKKEGLLIVNQQQMLPMPVIAGNAEYPKNVVEEVTAMGVKVKAASASALAMEQGDARAANVVLLGILARYLDFPMELWQDAIRHTVKEKLIDMNLRAFEVGCNQ
ncbi:MAG TPA: indolepyruvate oxidoreductase subunit beta [Peptococcaceae bacterium]|nr:indolepyruvate oxidoreductase subunit beta [Peptococcaceae bacterium]